EYADDPGRMLEERQRVARAGYIETPTELFDWLFAVAPYTTIHKWYVNELDGELVLTRKRPQIAEHRFAALLDHLRREDPYLERWLEKRPHLFTTQFFWSGRIPWRYAEVSPYEALGSAEHAAEFASERLGSSDFFWGSG